MIKTILLVLCLSTASLLAADEKESERKTDALQAETVWQGVAHGDSHKIKSASHPARLKVLERDKEKFTAELWVQRRDGQRAGLKLDGRLRGTQVAMRPVKILRGVWGNDILDSEIPGTLKGEELIFEAKNDRNQIGYIELKLDRDAKREKGKGKGE
jgi:hypothetical protein